MIIRELVFSRAIQKVRFMSVPWGIQSMFMGWGEDETRGKHTRGTLRNFPGLHSSDCGVSQKRAGRPGSERLDPS